MFGDTLTAKIPLQITGSAAWNAQQVCPLKSPHGVCVVIPVRQREGLKPGGN